MSPSGWFTSSYSNGDNGCVEVSLVDSAAVGVRDTKDRGVGPVLAVDTAAWAEFLAEVAAGRPHSNGALTVTERVEAHHYPVRGRVDTRWHLRCLTDGAELHFDDREWDAFRRGAAEGQFPPPRIPATTC